MLLITHWPYFIHLCLISIQENKEVEDDNIASLKITLIFFENYNLKKKIFQNLNHVMIFSPVRQLEDCCFNFQDLTLKGRL